MTETIKRAATILSIICLALALGSSCRTANKECHEDQQKMLRITLALAAAACAIDPATGDRVNEGNCKSLLVFGVPDPSTCDDDRGYF